MTPTGSGRVDQSEQDLRAHALLLVRSGLLDASAQVETMVAAIELQMPDTDASVLARAWLAAATKHLRQAAESWESVTDHDRLQSALGECAANGIQVHQAVGADDLRERVRTMPQPERGVLWFIPEAVYAALETGVLDVSLRHPSGALPPEGDPLVVAVLACLERHGLRARWHEDRLQVATRWRRRP